MQLPFLKKQYRDSGVAVQMRKPDETSEPKDDELEGLKACARDLIDAVRADDVAGVAAAFKAAFELCEMYPHDEVEHDEASQE